MEKEYSVVVKEKQNLLKRQKTLNIIQATFQSLLDSSRQTKQETAHDTVQL